MPGGSRTPPARPRGAWRHPTTHAVRQRSAARVSTTIATSAYSAVMPKTPTRIGGWLVSDVDAYTTATAAARHACGRSTSRRVAYNVSGRQAIVCPANAPRFWLSEPLIRTMVAPPRLAGALRSWRRRNKKVRNEAPHRSNRKYAFLTWTDAPSATTAAYGGKKNAGSRFAIAGVPAATYGSQKGHSRRTIACLRNSVLGSHCHQVAPGSRIFANGHNPRRVHSS